MALVTLTSIITAVRNRGDYKNSRVMTDAVITEFANSALAELYGLFVRTHEEYATTHYNLATQTGQASVDLPATLFKFRGIDRLVSGNIPATTTEFTDATYQEVRPAPLSERNRWQGRGQPVRYRLQNRSDSGETLLYLLPIPDAVYHLRLWYVPTYTALSDGADAFDCLNGFEELPIKLALRMCFEREERSTGDLDREIARLIERVIGEVGTRDTSEPPYLTDHTYGRHWDNDGEYLL